MVKACTMTKAIAAKIVKMKLYQTKYKKIGDLLAWNTISDGIRVVSREVDIALSRKKWDELPSQQLLLEHMFLLEQCYVYRWV
jgi:hypothetical protein